MALAFPGGPVVRDLLSVVLFSTKLSWLIPIPLFIVQAACTHRALNIDLLIDVNKIQRGLERSEKKRVIYTITTKGENTVTLRQSFDSTRYWLSKVKEIHNLSFDSEIWVVTEADSYREKPAFFNELESDGAILVVTPQEYRTLHDSKFKARALHFASELRQEKGINTLNDWVYHQDTETMVGEDTVLGNLDYIIDADDNQLIGSGIILYPQNWRYHYNSVEETTRSVNDIGAIGQMRLWGIVPFGYHGSHLIVRADVENEIGWDFGEVRSEDLLFSLKLREKFGAVTRPMKGFAYEKPPLTMGDQLKQRRRWILGTIEVLRRRDVALKFKAPIIYSLSSWLSALPSIIASILGLVYPTGGIFPFIGGFFTGFIWWTIYSAYKVGLDLHDSYVSPFEPWKKMKILAGAALGLFFDALAPWYALVKRTSRYEEIKKDL